MKRMIMAAAAAAGSLALLGGALVATGAPALASPVNTSWGADASGPQTLAPVAVATPDDTANAASNANLAGLLATSAIVDRADDSGAWSRIGQGVVLTLPNLGKLTANGVRSWCREDFDGDAFGGATIFSGAIAQIGNGTYGLPQNPAPNTVINLPYGAGTITLNYQNFTAGVATFAAVHAVLGGQTVNLAVSQCWYED